MANVIRNEITVKNCNDEVINYIKSLFEFKKGDNQNDEVLRRVLSKENENNDIEDLVDRCGAKWLSYENSLLEYEDYIITLESGNWPVNEWVEMFAEKLRQIQPDILVYNEYTDVDAFTCAGIYMTANQYENHHEEDMEEWDNDRLVDGDDDGEYIEEFYGSLRETLNYMKEDYNSFKE